MFTKKKNHIVYITSYYPPHLGGMENCGRILASGFAKKGYMVDVVTSDIGYKRVLAEKQKNLRVSYLRSVEVAHTPIIFSLFLRLLTMARPDVMHVHIAHALTPEIVFLIAKMRKIPYVVHIHLDVDPSGKFGFLLKPYKKLFLAHVIRNAAKVICLSEKQRDEIQKKYQVPEKNLAIVPNGVGQEFFLDRNNNRHRPHILFVGRLAPQKNLPRLLQAVAYMKKYASIDIVGEGEEREILERIIKQENLKHVVLHGIKQGKELLALYKNADVFVLPSEKEGVSLAMLEAMAAGLPVVAFNLSGIRDIIHDCGILVKNRSSKALAQALDLLIENIRLRKNLSQKATKKAQQFTWQNAITEIESIYKEVTYDA